MKKINGIIDSHGGWPGAFQTTKACAETQEQYKVKRGKKKVIRQ